MSDFVEAYRERKREENAFEFADISHYTIEILENFPKVRQGLSGAFPRSHWSMSIRIPTIFKNGCWNCFLNGYNRFMVGDIKQSIYRFRQADPQILMRNSNAMHKILKKES